MTAPFTLRPYQEAAVESLRQAYRSARLAPLLVLPTGGGKTQCFSFIARETAGRGKSVLILAHRRELVRQASRKLHEAGVRHGIIAPGFSRTRDPVQVASVQTLGRRLGTLPEFALIIIDEAHHAVAGQWDKVIKAQPRARLLGVTATPERSDGRGLGVQSGGCFDCIVTGPSVADLTAQGHLSPARVYAPAEAPDLSGIRTKGGDFDAGQLEARINVSTITGDVLAHWRRHALGLPTIAFCISVQHAQDVAATFRAAGVRAVCGHGGLPDGERDAAINGLGTGAVEVLATCDLVSEGLDVPAVGAVILLRPTKSLGLYLQQVGRGLRPAPGKARLIVLDHAGCTVIHGLPDAPREWSLAGRPKGVKAPATWQCPSCFAVQKPAPACVACGHVVPVPEDKPGEGRSILQADGELQEVDPARVAHLRAAPLHSLVSQARTDADLREIARARGYKAGWVWKIQQERRQRALPEVAA